jgi:hypothetical protein
VTQPGISVALETQSATGLESRFGARSTYILKSEPLLPEFVRELVKELPGSYQFRLISLAAYCF